MLILSLMIKQQASFESSYSHHKQKTKKQDGNQKGNLRWSLMYFNGLGETKGNVVLQGLKELKQLVISFLLIPPQGLLFQQLQTGSLL